MNAQIMGILNVTPDSFFDGGRYTSLQQATERALQMIKEGVDIIDIGGESTRPGSSPISEEEELNRVLPIIQEIRKYSNIALSIDTMKPKVAEEAVKAGATLINDVTGFEKEEMVTIARRYGTKICIMHMKGTPKTMQNDPIYPEGILTHLLSWFEKRTTTLLNAGISKDNILLDPGIGFGKTVEDNVKILQNVPTLLNLGFPLLIGLSRKSFLGKITGKDRENLLIPTLAANAAAVLAGAHTIRVHDVKEHRDMLRYLRVYKAS